MSRIDEDDTKVFTDHNVYILGAGFSAAAGIPVVRDFLYDMRSSLSWLSAHNRQREREAVEEVLRFRKNAASAALRVKLNVENIEDLFSLAAASGQYPLAETVSMAIAATVSFGATTREGPPVFISVKHGLTIPDKWELRQEADQVNKYNAPLYDLHAGLLSGLPCGLHAAMRNTVITFNYDTVLENALSNWKLKSWYGFESNSVEYDDTSTFVSENNDDLTLPVLKLHGSVNWAMPQENGRLRIYGSYEELLGQNRQVLLVPPTWRKTFSGPISHVWDAAVRALRDATRIVIIGFSIPPTDIHFKYLLAAGLQENISLRKIFCINTDTEIEGNLFKILREDLNEQKLVHFSGIRSEDIFFAEACEGYKTLPELIGRSFFTNIMRG